MADTPMTFLHPDDDVTEHILSVAMELLASGRATATEVAELSDLPLQRVERWIDHDARGIWLAKQWNTEMATLEDDHTDSMGYIPSRYLLALGC
jgi:hypothetical protein